MTTPPETRPVFRFAPSPNGPLHPGHALSALLNADMARETCGRLLLRIDDVDQTRARAHFEQAILEDLAWLDLHWETPLRRQSAHVADYQAALDRLIAMDLAYPSTISRAQLRMLVDASERAGIPWPRDPDGAPLAPPDERGRSAAVLASPTGLDQAVAWRLDVAKAVSKVGSTVVWQELDGPASRAVSADPSAWGDVVLKTKDGFHTYTLAVVVDDAAQGVSHVVRGQDLYHATAIHRLLQIVLGLPEPVYHHHRLILGADGQKLSKSRDSRSLAALRESGLSPADIRTLVGLAPA